MQTISPVRRQRLAARTALLLAGAICLALGSAPASALAIGITIDVTTNVDEFGAGAGCSLREAVKTANDDAAFGGCARVGVGGAETILVPGGSLAAGTTYTLTLTGSDALAAVGDLDVRGSVTIRSTGSQAARVGANPALGDRAFEIISGTVSLTDLQLVSVSGGLHVNSGATAILHNLVISGHQAALAGGLSNYGTVSMTDSLVQNNLASGSHGGGIYNAGVMTLTQTLVQSNTTASSNSHGGGIYNTFSVHLTQSALVSNTVAGNSLGGGLFSGFNSLVVMLDSQVISNTASDGGGLYCEQCLAIIGGSAILSNTARNNAGGIYWRPIIFAGGEIRTSTISGNRASQFGGGIFFAPDENLTIYFTTITNNTSDSDVNAVGDGGGFYATPGPGQWLPQGLLLAGNHDPETPDCQGGQLAATQGYNLIGNNLGCTFTGTDSDQVGANASPINPLLGLLRNNGGPTLTHALLAGSPAIDGGLVSASCFPAIDQRGVPRTEDGDNSGEAQCDVGAYEFLAALVSNKLFLPQVQR